MNIPDSEQKAALEAITELLSAHLSEAEGFLADIEKYFEAALAGWTVLRLTERQLTLEAMARIVWFVKSAPTDGCGQTNLPLAKTVVL